jgi:D-3-phosphoglycerate dehydrogenase
MKIVIAEKISPAAIKLFREETEWQVVTADDIKTGVAAELAGADALIVRSAVYVDSAMLEHADKLRVIGRAGVGVDNIDLEAATKKGIAVMNTPGANAVAVAEHTLGLMLDMARQISRANELMHAGKWEKKSLQGWELRGKTLGVVGLGRIGIEVAKRAVAFGMNVVAHDPYISPALVRDLGVKLADLDEVLSTADYLSLHVALTPQTTGLINAESIKKMKKGVRIVNCARGELVNEGALAEGLKSGHVAGAALDVFTQEPLKSSPLLAPDVPNVLLTPHIAGSTYEAQDAVGVQIAMQVKEYLKSGVIQNAVNVPSLTHDEFVQINPYVGLGERLGGFVAQTTSGNVEEISIRYSGPIAEWKTELVRNAVIKGILNQGSADTANLVNAAKMAAERGIQIREAHKPQGSVGGSANVLTVELKSSQEERVVKGSVLHGNSPRLLSVDGIDVEAPLADNLIFMRNRDVPGVIGAVGTILGEQGVNIAAFSLGRGERNAAGAEAGSSGKALEPAEAVAVVHIDGPAPGAVLEKLAKIPAVRSVRAVHL